jgi:hypothetical protein
MAEDYVVKGMSKANLERSALKFLVRYKKSALEDDADPLDVEELLGDIMYEHSKYAFCIRPDDEFPLDVEALTSFYERVIELKQSDFDKLSIPSRSRFTACHEIAHAILHTSQLEHLRKPGEGVELFRKKEDIPTYQQADWQAETFSSALLMPIIPAVRLYKSLLHDGFCIEMIIEAFVKRFMVTWSAAEVRVDMIRGYIRKGEDKRLEQYVKKISSVTPITEPN